MWIFLSGAGGADRRSRNNSLYQSLSGCMQCKACQLRMFAFYTPGIFHIVSFNICEFVVWFRKWRCMTVVEKNGKRKNQARQNSHRRSTNSVIRRLWLWLTKTRTGRHLGPMSESRFGDGLLTCSTSEFSRLESWSRDPIFEVLVPVLLLC